MTYRNYTRNCKTQPLNIDLVPFDRDERAVYVDSVLEVLLESRFGPGRFFDPYELQFSDVPQAFVNFDLMPTGFTCERLEMFLRTAGSRSGCSVDDHIESPGSLTSANLTAPLYRSPSTLARGSPDHLRPQHPLLNPCH